MTIRRFVLSFVLALSGAVAIVFTCGEEFPVARPVLRTRPADLERYGRGEIGIVKPQYERAFLVQAYRRMSALPAVPALASQMSELRGDEPGGGATAWEALSGSPVRRWRYLKDTYQSFENCPEDAFATAARTHAARARQYGASSPELQAWLRAQVAVFSNCDGDQAQLPEAAPAAADALTRADREYQAASAQFYAMKYDDAARRFRAIAANRESPWRIYGRYLAARATLRMATVAEQDEAKQRLLLADAEGQLREVLKDPGAASLHDSTRGLIDFVVARLRPVERLHAVSTVLATAPQVSAQQVVDYRMLLDRLIGNTVDYEYTAVASRDELTRNDPLNDWVLAMQGTGEAAAARALQQWKATTALPWLVAALWKVPPAHAETPALLAAAARVDERNAAYSTIAFLRARLLAARGDRAGARALLATLPRTLSATVRHETLNLIDALRFATADSFDELLASAPRRPLPDYWLGDESAPLDPPVFDDDAAQVFTRHLPLARLIEASLAGTLPSRLQLRVATAAFTRAILLGRDDQALRVAPVLHRLAPAVRRDLDAFTAATDAASRRRAVLLLLLRTPGMHTNVRGLENQIQYERTEPKRELEHREGSNWWCSTSARGYEERSALLPLLYGSENAPAPAFLSADERRVRSEEAAALAKTGAASRWLAEEAIRWATASPRDERAAEALARAIAGARWRCWGDEDKDVSRRAFQTLHRLFPKSVWAARTKYWY